MKKVLITGATSGIGEGLAIALAKKGYELYLTGRNVEKLHLLQNELGARILPCALEEDYRPLLGWMETFTPDLIINNAGFGLYGDLIHHHIEEQTAIVRVNCEALLAITQKGAQLLRALNKPGTILNISSSAGFQPFPSFATYAASKSFVTSLSTSLHEELLPHNIAVLVSCPGRIATNFASRASKTPKPAPGYIMPLDYAISRILRQIETKKPRDIFDWHYQLLIHFSRFIPDRWICKLLRKKANLN